MKKSPRSLGLVLAPGLIAMFSVTTLPKASAQSAAAAALEVPAKTIPVPTDVSPQLQKIIGAPLRSNWDIHPKSGEEWKPVADAGAAALIKNVPGMLERLKVKVEKTNIDGVRVFIVTPKPSRRKTATDSSSTCMAAATCSIPAKPACRKRSSWPALGASR
jgi:monoterpene epsilon-lactone hydrolase